MAQAELISPTLWVGHHVDEGLLREMLRALGSEPDVEVVARASSPLIEAAMGWELDAMRLALPDARGHLRAVLSTGEDLIDDDSLERARAVFDRKVTIRLPARGGSMAHALTIPLVSRGSAYGVLDVVAPPHIIDERWDTLDVVLSQVAVALSNATARTSLDRDRETMRKAAVLGADLARVRTREEALREIVRGLHRDFGLRAAAWLVDGGDPILVSARGIGSGRRDRLRAIVATGSSDLPARLASTFSSVISSEDPELIDAGAAVVVMDALGDLHQREALDLVKGVTGQLLGWLSSLEHLRRRNLALDTALTLTAHELRGPMLAAKATIDGMLQEAGRAADDRARLRDSRRQLEELAETVDPLLRWSVSGDRLRRRAGDLVGVVIDAIDSVARETGEDRVILELPLDPVRVQISRRHVSFAIQNLIRNAIAFSPSDSVVAVRIVSDEATTTISVHDGGIGVAAEDVDAIFEPFARGRSGRSVRAGNGLGLFVVQRVADSHGGRVWVDSAEIGTTFHLTLPLRSGAGERKEGSTSKR